MSNPRSTRKKTFSRKNYPAQGPNPLLKHTRSKDLSSSSFGKRLRHGRTIPSTFHDGNRRADHPFHALGGHRAKLGPTNESVDAWKIVLGLFPFIFMILRRSSADGRVARPPKGIECRRRRTATGREFFPTSAIWRRCVLRQGTIADRGPQPSRRC